MVAPLPSTEINRLASLRSFDVLDTPPQAEYDDLTRLAAAVCGTPIAVISLIDTARQWFKSRFGIDADETPRDVAFCAHTILGDDLFEVPNATEDGRFHDNPLVTGAPHIRFYAGMPLTTPEGENVGSLCAIDRVPKELTPVQRDAMRILARQVVARLVMRRQVAELRAEVERRRKLESGLRASEAKFRNTVDRLAEGVFVADAATARFVEANASLLAMLGYTSVEFLGLATSDVVAGEPPDVLARNLADVQARLAADGRCDLGRRLYRRKDGSTFPVDVRVTVVPNDAAGLHAVIVRDVSEEVEHETRLYEYQAELEAANAKLKALSTTDALTEVRNRAAFDARLGEEFERAVRYGHPLSVILLDVDHFKEFNDAHGHPAGDDVLRAVGRTLKAAARGTDVVARYGGEEFALVLPDTDRGGAQVLAERCRRAIAAEPWAKRAVTVSVGVSTLTPTTADAAGLVSAADAALYRSKQQGRNRVTHASGSVPAAATAR